jgi:hypothetical protein
MILFLLFVLGVVIIIVVLGRSKKERGNVPKDIFTVTDTSHDNVIEFSVGLNEKELKKRISDGTIADSFKDEEFSLMDVTGFYGFPSYSPNKKYCVSFCDGHFENDKWKKGNLAVLYENKLLFKKRIERPHDCKVADDGIAICCDWQNSDELAGKFLIFDKEGQIIYSHKTSANLGSASISDDSTISIFETYGSDTTDSNKIFIVDIGAKKILKKIDRPVYFSEVKIDPLKRLLKLKDKKGLVFELDFNGLQTNRADYENQIMQKGSVLDKIYLFDEKPDEICFQDINYLNVLTQALNNKEACDRLRKESIYKRIGEWHLANNDTEMAIENWEKALKLNPKVGLKRKLESLKKQQP